MTKSSRCDELRILLTDKKEVRIAKYMHALVIAREIIAEVEDNSADDHGSTTTNSSGDEDRG